MSRDIPLVFDCAGSALVGMAHDPDAPAGQGAKRGVLIVVGGPQYRVGSHRQFLLLARSLADAGIPAMRFDYRGMGDSDGEFAGFENIDDDIRAAVPEIEEVVLWGLCDAASAILFYAAHDPRVAATVLLNPWVRSDAGFAQAQIKHYYAGRLASRAFWRDVFRGRIDIPGAVASFLGIARQARTGRGDNPLAERMAAGLHAFARPTLLILSGNDLTAREFESAVTASPAWRALLEEGYLSQFELPDADHTFSRESWRDAVADETARWVRALPPTG